MTGRKSSVQMLLTWGQSHIIVYTTERVHSSYFLSSCLQNITVFFSPSTFWNTITVSKGEVFLFGVCVTLNFHCVTNLKKLFVTFWQFLFTLKIFVFSFRSCCHCCYGPHVSGVVCVGRSGPRGFLVPHHWGRIPDGSNWQHLDQLHMLPFKIVYMGLTTICI